MGRFLGCVLTAASMLAALGSTRGAVPLAPDPLAVVAAGDTLIAISGDQQVWRRSLGPNAEWRMVAPPPGEESFRVMSIFCAADGSGLCIFSRSDGRTALSDLFDTGSGTSRRIAVDGELDAVADRHTAYVVRSRSDGARDLYRFGLDNGAMTRVGGVRPNEAIAYLRVDGVLTPLAHTPMGDFREISDLPGASAFHFSDFENLTATPEGGLIVETWAHDRPIRDGLRYLADLRLARGKGGIELQGKWFFGFPTSGPLPAPGRLAADANNDVVLEMVGPDRAQLGILCNSENEIRVKGIADLPVAENVHVGATASASGFLLTSTAVGHTPQVQLLRLSPSVAGGWRSRPCGTTEAVISDANIAVVRDDKLDIRTGEAVSADGSKVPFMIVSPKGIVPRHAIIDVYGAFGQRREIPDYQPATKRMLADAATALVFPIVRGDGDKGFAWAMASAAPHRQRAVDDLIAVAQATAAALPMLTDRPTVRGQSAGGWLAVKAVLERPDLFAGAVGYSGAYLMAGEPFAEQNTQRFFDPQADDLAKDVKALAGNCRGLRFRLLHARDDEKVPFDSVVAFAGQLRAQGCAVEEVSFDNGGHLIALDLSRAADGERRLKAYFTPF